MIHYSFASLGRMAAVPARTRRCGASASAEAAALPEAEAAAPAAARPRRCAPGGRAVATEYSLVEVNFDPVEN